MATPTPSGTNPTESDLEKVIRLIVTTQDELGEATAKFKEFRKQSNLVSKDMGNISSMSTQINKLLNDTASVQGRIGSEYIKQKNIEVLRKKLLADEATIKERLSVVASKTYDVSTEMLKSESKIKKAIEDQEKLLKKTVKSRKDTSTITEKLVELQEKLRMLDIDGSEERAAETAILQQQLNSLNEMKTVHENMNKLIEEGNKKIVKRTMLGELFKELPGFIQVAIKNVEKFGLVGGLALAGITGAIMLVKEWVSWTFELSKRVTEMGNNLNISKDSAMALDDAFAYVVAKGQKLTDTLDSSLFSLANLENATNDLNAQFGTSVIATQQMLENQISLTKELGFSVEESKGINTFALLNKKNALDIVTTIGKQNKGLLNTKDIIKDVSKVNDMMVSQYGNSVEALSKAVILTKQYGMNLDQANSAAQKLLDFESSISNELEAELLTGKAWNLEKARSLALDGDSAGAMKEMLKNVGSYAEFSKQNTIVKEAEAKAVGMTSLELASALRTQDALNALGEENQQGLQERYKTMVDMHDTAKMLTFEEDLKAKRNGDFLLQNIKNLDLQTRMEQSVGKLKDLLFKALPSIEKMVNGFISLLDHITLIKNVLLAVGAIWVGIEAAAIATAIATSFATGGLSAIGGAAGAAAIGAAVGGAALVGGAIAINDGVVNPDGRLSITTPEGGLIIPNKKDSLIATTNPEGLLNQSQGSSSSDNSGILSKLDQIASILMKGGNVYIDSNKSGTVSAMGYSSFA